MESKEEYVPYMDHDMSMKMYFHASAHSMILFKTWMTHSWQQMLGSCVALFLIAILYEGLKVGRELLQHRTAHGRSQNSEIFSIRTFKNEEAPEYGTTTSNSQLTPARRPTVMSRIFNTSHIIQSLLHFVQVWISFCLMLVFMTYNVWLCLAVTLGAMVGYFAFAWVRTGNEADNEHCN